MEGHFERDPKGTLGGHGPQGALGGWAHGALWGYSEAIPNGRLFRMESYFEWVPWVGLGWTERF